jgi:hypothetical protein
MIKFMATNPCSLKLNYSLLVPVKLSGQNGLED